MSAEQEDYSPSGAEKDQSPKMGIWLIIIFVGAVVIGLGCFVLAALSIVE